MQFCCDDLIGSYPLEAVASVYGDFILKIFKMYFYWSIVDPQCYIHIWCFSDKN